MIKKLAHFEVNSTVSATNFCDKHNTKSAKNFIHHRLNRQSFTGVCREDRFSKPHQLTIFIIRLQLTLCIRHTYAILYKLSNMNLKHPNRSDNQTNHLTNTFSFCYSYYC